MRKPTQLISSLVFCTLVTPLGTLAQTQGNLGKSQVHGLEKIQLDSFTQILAQGRGLGLFGEDLRAQILLAAESSQNEQQLFKKLTAILKATRLSTAEDYEALGKNLLELRMNVRNRTDISRNSKQDSLFLLQMLSEESLYVGSKKFSSFPKEIAIEGNISPSLKATALREFAVQTGDVVLSKSTGFGSSSFISLTMSHPHIFSHSTPVYVDGQGLLLSPEAEIEDGVKLRKMQKDYVEGSKTRLYIYRYQGADSSVPAKIEAGMEGFVAEMNQRTGGDPFNKPAFKYDFSMTPGNADTKGLFCSAVAYEVYQRAGVGDAANPYSKAIWSPINSGREILLRSLNMNADRVPAPGDVELNRNFQLVGARIDIEKLHQDRIEMAIIDSFLAQVDSNKVMMAELAKSIETLGSKPLDKVKVLALVESGVLPKELASKMALIEKVPDSINIKQMAFFAFLNEVLTPKMRAAMLYQISELEKNGKIVGPLELRKMAQAQFKNLSSDIVDLRNKLEKLSGVSSCGRVF